MQYQYRDLQAEDEVRQVQEIISTVLSLRTDLSLTKARPNCKLNALLVMTVRYFGI